MWIPPLSFHRSGKSNVWPIYSSIFLCNTILQVPYCAWQQENKNYMHEKHSFLLQQDRNHKHRWFTTPFGHCLYHFQTKIKTSKTVILPNIDQPKHFYAPSRSGHGLSNAYGESQEPLLLHWETIPNFRTNNYEKQQKISSVYAIMLTGRWSSDAFPLYIRKPVQDFSKGIRSKRSKMRDSSQSAQSLRWIIAFVTIPWTYPHRTSMALIQWLL